MKAKLSHSFNYIKIRKDKTSQNNEQSTKVKPKLQKAKPKVLKEHTLSVTHDDFKDSVSQNVRGSTLKKSKNASKEVDTHRIIHEQEIRDLTHERGNSFSQGTIKYYAIREIFHVQ